MKRGGGGNVAKEQWSRPASDFGLRLSTKLRMECGTDVLACAHNCLSGLLVTPMPGLESLELVPCIH